MEMGRPTAFWLPSKSVIWGRRFGFLVQVWLLVCIDNFDCGWIPTSDGTLNFQVSNNQGDHERQCSSAAAGSKQLERGVELSIHHAHGPCSPLGPINSNWTAVMFEMMDRDRYRMQALQSDITSRLPAAEADIPIEPGQKYSSGNFVARLGFGTPEKSFLLVLDTSSVLSWIQCRPCTKCYAQFDPIFDPKGSRTYKVLGCWSRECKQLDKLGYRRSCFLNRSCRYGVRYVDGDRTLGYLSQDRLSVATDLFGNFVFGCGNKNEGSFRGSAGILGLGRSPPSLPNQTASRYNGYFSHCLPDYRSPTAVGSLRFGPSAVSPSNVVFTTMLSNPRRPSLYYVGLSGISLGTQRLRIPQEVFELTGNGGGTSVDSGTVITHLVRPAYEALKAAFVENAPNLGAAESYGPFDTCYNVPRGARIAAPTVTLHFSDSAAFELNRIGSVYLGSDRLCLAFLPSNTSASVIGNFQLQRVRVSYDTADNRIGFAHESCSPS